MGFSENMLAISSLANTPPTGLIPFRWLFSGDADVSAGNVTVTAPNVLTVPQGFFPLFLRCDVLSWPVITGIARPEFSQPTFFGAHPTAAGRNGTLLDPVLRILIQGVEANAYTGLYLGTFQHDVFIALDGDTMTMKLDVRQPTPANLFEMVRFDITFSGLFVPDAAFSVLSPLSMRVF